MKESSIYTKILILTILIFTNLFSKDINYYERDIHTLTPKKGDLTIKYSNIQMNDRVDILNIKGSEFGNSASLNAIGDMSGYEIGISYALKENIFINYQREIQDIDLLGGTFSNTKDNVYVRFHLFERSLSTFNSGISLDIGYETNKLDDYTITDTSYIEQLVKKNSAVSDFKITQNSDGSYKVAIDYADGNSAIDSNVSTKPYVSIVNTKDRSYYLRLLTGYYTKSSIYDFYVGYKRTKIQSQLTSSDSVKNMVNSSTTTLQLPIVLDRSESMLSLGFNITSDFKYFIAEFGYEYEKFFRDITGPQPIDYNHIINLTLVKPITRNFSVFAGGKIMYRQFNGQIPYLYNEYTQSSYDHKYGYARFGLQYRFSL